MNPKAFQDSIIRKFKDSKLPIYGIFELTGRCNFNCKMCYVHTKSNAEFLQTEKSGDWWIAQIDKAYEKGMLFALLTGGECLLHPDFHRIYSHLREKGVYTRINTNGVLLNSKNIDFLKKNPPLEIQLTVYGSDDSAYKAVTGVSAFKQIDETIRRIKDADLKLKIAVTPNSFAPGETEKIIRYLNELQVPYSVNGAMFTPYDDENTQTTLDDVDIDEKIRFLKIQSSIDVKAVAEEKLPAVGGGCKEVKRGIRCSAGRVSFTISNDGYMMPCFSMYHLRVPLEEVGFDAAWEQMLNIGANYLMPIECEGCAYKKACLPCVVARSGKAGNGHCDPAVCEMTRKLVAAGVKKLEEPQESCE